METSKRAANPIPRPAADDTGPDPTAAGRGRTVVGPHLSQSAEHGLGDFTATPELLRLVPLALIIGVLSAGVSLLLLDMIGFVTNLVYFHRLSVRLVSPGGSSLGVVSVAIPVLGGLVVGLMARFGSEQIRGHGIPRQWSGS
jgi:H+/Cl- antiporter ClcA